MIFVIAHAGDRFDEIVVPRVEGISVPVRTRQSSDVADVLFGDQTAFDDLY